MIHTQQGLIQLQSLDLDAKVRMSQERIRAWYDYFDGDVYVAFSGGKDSTVLLHLVRSIYPNVPAVFHDTGVEFPEIREFVRTFENVVRTKPKKTFRQVIEEYGYPLVSKRVAQYVHEAGGCESMRHLRTTGIKKDGTFSPKSRISTCWQRLIDAPFKVSDQCCKVLKHRPSEVYEKITGQHGYVGTMASDSEQRALTWKRFGCNAFDAKQPVSKPLSFWTEADIWKFIRAHGIKTSNIYDMGYSRTGCIFCGFGVHMSSPNRFQLLQETHPKLWEYAMKPWSEGGLGMAEPLEFIGVEVRSQMRLFKAGLLDGEANEGIER